MDARPNRAATGFRNRGTPVRGPGRLAEAEEYDAIDVVYDQIRAATSMTLPDGTQVAEYLLYIHADGTRGWRWHDEPFDDAADH